MKTKINWIFAVTLTGLASSFAATSAFADQPLPLQGRTITGEAVASTDPSAVMEYDPNLNITWLRDWNQNGQMNWESAMAWAANLTVGSFGGWQLPSIDPGDTTCDSSYSPGAGLPLIYRGYGCRGAGSPMGYMYYTELGNTRYSTPGWSLSNTGPFLNVQVRNYWSSTPSGPGGAWNFSMYGLTDNVVLAGTPNLYYAVAIRYGDVAAAVPEAQTWAMLMVGLGAVAGVARRRRVR